MGEDRHIVVSQPMKDFDRFFDLEPARHEQECSRRNERLVQRGELGRTESRFSGHQIFPEQIGVLDHCALEWLKDHAAPFQIFRNHVALDQLIVRKNHSRRVFVEPARILQNIFTVVFRKRRTDFERRQIEKSNIGKSPGLIFPGRRRQLFELLPRFALLIMKPIGEFAQLARPGENRRGFDQFVICD